MSSLTSGTSTALLSEPRPRLSRKSKSDPFFDLPPTSSTIPSSSEHRHGSKNGAGTPHHQQDELNEQDDGSYSFIYRAVMTPILFTSFLLSLFLVNRSDLARRASNSSNATSSASSASYFSPKAWFSPEPYQNRRHSDPTPNTTDIQIKEVEDFRIRREGSSAEPKGSHTWFYRKKHRAMAKLAISDAFDQRGRIIASMVAIISLCLGMFFWSLRMAYTYWIAR